MGILGFTIYPYGVHSNDIGVNMLDYRIPIVPPLRKKLEEIPGRPGAYDFGTEFGSTPIEIDIYLKGTRQERKRTRRQLIKYINPTKKHIAELDPGVIEIEFDEEPGVIYPAKLDDRLDPNRLLEFETATLLFINNKTFSRSKTKAGTGLDDKGLFYDTNLEYEDQDKYKTEILLKSSSGSLDLYNLGNTEVIPKILYTGSGSNIKITNNTTGEEILFTGSISPGDSLSYNSKNYTALLNGVERLDLFEGFGFTLDPGLNSISISGSGISDLLIQFDFYYNYL